MTTSVMRDGARQHDDRRFALVVVVLYFVCTGFVLSRHEMWFDEMQAWQLARSAGSIADLIASKRYEGHPDVWYLMLFGVSRISRNPAAMQVLHLFLASAVAYVVARWAPFGRLTRVFLVCGYYLAYEYAVISRAYVLGVLALFTLCALCVSPSRWSARPVAVAALLAVLANTSAYGLILAGALGLALVIDVATQPSAWLELRRRPWLVLAAVLLATAAIAWSVHSILPPPAAPFAGQRVAAQTGTGQWLSGWRLWLAISSIWRGYVPGSLSALAGAIGDADPSINATVNSARVGLVLSALVVVGTLLVTRRRLAAVVLFLAGAGVIVYFTYCCFIGSVRHEGHMYLVFVASAWLAMGAPPAKRGRVDRVAAAIVTTFACVHVVLGARAIARDVMYPFSTGRQAAAVIKSRGWQQLPIVATPRAEAVVISGFLDRPVFNPEIGGEMTYAKWAVPVDPPQLARVFAGVDSLARAGSSDVVVVSTFRLPRSARGMVLTEIARFDESIVTSERFQIYLAHPNE